MTEVELIKLPEVRRLTGLSTSYIYKHAAEGSFPKQVKLGEHSVAWVKGEVLGWIEGRMSLRIAS